MAADPLPWCPKRKGRRSGQSLYPCGLAGTIGGTEGRHWRHGCPELGSIRGFAEPEGTVAGTIGAPKGAARAIGIIASGDGERVLLGADQRHP
jgi:hypothetical protein